jgi:hypothetical protein
MITLFLYNHRRLLRDIASAYTTLSLRFPIIEEDFSREKLSDSVEHDGTD